MNKLDEIKNSLTGDFEKDLNAIIGKSTVITTSADNKFVQPLYESDSGLTISTDTTSYKVPVGYNLDVPDDFIKLQLNESGETTSTVEVNPKFVENYFEALELADSINKQLKEAQDKIKKFIEDHKVGSFESNGMKVKYTPSTTTTTISSSKLKKLYPDIAAECSNVSARKSSISIQKV